MRRSISARRFIALLPQHDGTATLCASDDGLQWERAAPAISLPADAALARGPDDALCVAYRDAEGRVWAAIVEDDTRIEPRRIGGARTQFCPAIAWWRDTLVVAAVDDDGALVVARSLGDEALRFRRAHAFARAGHAPALAATPARVYLGFTGTDGAVYLGSSDDGATFDLLEVARADRRGEGDPIEVAPTLCAWGPDIAMAVSDRRQRLLVATSRDAPSLRLVHVGGAARSSHAPAIALSDDGYTLLVAGTDGALWTATDSLDALSLQQADAPGVARSPSLAASRRGEPQQPSRTTVVPVLFYPADVREEPAQRDSMREAIEVHMTLAQQRYRQWLETDTFDFDAARVVRGNRAHRDYRHGDAWTDVLHEILLACGDCDATSTNLYVALFVRPAGFDGELWLGSGGAGCTEGSGLVLLDARCVLEDEPYCFQSTLVHELGHGFGLPHVEAWGEPMDTCESIMSYNQRHCVRGAHAPEPEAILLPEELALLGANQVAFPRFAFDPAVHNPTGAPLRKSNER